MGGAIGNNGWSGNNFSLTPHAGFYGIPVNQTTAATMEMGRKMYIHEANCASSTNLAYNGIYETSNSPTTGQNCNAVQVGQTWQ